MSDCSLLLFPIDRVAKTEMAELHPLELHPFTFKMEDFIKKKIQGLNILDIYYSAFRLLENVILIPVVLINFLVPYPKENKTETRFNLL